MARPKRQLTIENIQQASDAASYFKRMFETDSRYLESTLVKKKGESVFSVRREAHEQLDALPRLYESIHGRTARKTLVRPTEVTAALEAFRAWADEYVTDRGWARCLSNLRQAKHRKPGATKFISLKLPAETHFALQRWASMKSLTLNDAMLDLLRIANAPSRKR